MMRQALILLLCLSAVPIFGDMIGERRKFRQRLENPATFQQAAKEGMNSGDPAIRLYALSEYTRKYGEKALPELDQMVEDKDERIINFLTMFAAAAQDKAAGNRLLKLVLEKNPDQKLRRLAARYISTFNFFRKTSRIKFDPQWDHEIQIIKTVDLPLKGWKFATDPMADGHDKKFFAVDFDNSKWREINIGDWKAQGFPDYHGIAWYRITFRMPEKIDHNAVELHFRGVDEAGWVWLNGVYAGQHDEGQSGWNIPFWLDVTKEIRWGAENTLVVRVENTTAAGGIWKPVSVEILK